MYIQGGRNQPAVQFLLINHELFAAGTSLTQRVLKILYIERVFTAANYNICVYIYVYVCMYITKYIYAYNYTYMCIYIYAQNYRNSSVTNVQV